MARHRARSRFDRALVVLLLASASRLSPSARADEGGTPFWASGQYASFAAVPDAPGWSLSLQGYYDSGDASITEAYTVGHSVTYGLKSRTPLLAAQPTYTPERKFLGGQLSLGFGIGYGKNTSKSDSFSGPNGTEVDKSDTVWGFADLFPVASLAWTSGVDNWMVYLTGDIPVGAYDASRLANIGIGHGAIDAGGGYTYLNPRTGREFSAVLGFTGNFENTSTDYRNGVDSHLDWAASQSLSAAWQVGLAGYVYYQLSADSGSGAKLGPFKSKVAAVGPQGSLTLNAAGASANLRGYWEFWAENRIKGFVIYATVTLPLGPQ
jgi:hypothetical protein